MKNNNFCRDLSIGSTGEVALATLLENAGLSVSYNKDPKKNKDYDISAKYEEGGRMLTFEVKYDVYAARSGNIAIEFYNPKSCKDSGLASTKADYWVHVVTNPQSVWIISVSELKEYIAKTPPFKVITCGGDDNASLYLYKQEKLFGEAFVRIDNMDKDFLKEILFKGD